VETIASSDEFRMDDAKSDYYVCRVNVVEASALPVSDMDLKCDPYVKILFDYSQHRRTRTLWDSDVKNGAEWNQCFTMFTTNPNPFIKFTVMDEDTLSEHDVIGTSATTLRDLCYLNIPADSKGTFEGDLEIGGTKDSKLKVKVSFHKLQQ